jgi:hypothetical protein
MFHVKHGRSPGTPAARMWGGGSHPRSDAGWGAMFHVGMHPGAHATRKRRGATPGAMQGRARSFTWSMAVHPGPARLEAAGPPPGRCTVGRDVSCGTSRCARGLCGSDAGWGVTPGAMQSGARCFTWNIAVHPGPARLGSGVGRHPGDARWGAMLHVEHRRAPGARATRSGAGHPRGDARWGRDASRGTSHSPAPRGSEGR